MKLLTHRRNIKDIHIGPAECQAGHLAHRHLDRPIDVTIGGVTHDQTVKYLRIPDEAFRIDGRSVSRASRRAQRCKTASVGDRPINGIIINANFAGV